jgi:hypothetical protein
MVSDGFGWFRKKLKHPILFFRFVGYTGGYISNSVLPSTLSSEMASVPASVAASVAASVPASSLLYSSPPHLSKRLALLRQTLLAEANDDITRGRRITEFEADDARFYASEARAAAREAAAFASIPAAEVADLRREMSAVWPLRRVDVPIEPAQYTFTTPEDVALITLYFDLHKDHLEILSLSGRRGSHGASGRLVPEWRKATAHLSDVHQQSLRERGGELCYVRSRTNPDLAPGTDEWQRIVYGASDAEVTAYNAQESAWREQTHDYIERGKSLWPAFKRLPFNTQVNLIRFAKNEAIVRGLKNEISDEEELMKLCEEVMERNYQDDLKEDREEL